MMLTLVVAMAKNRAIGKDGQLPWRLPEDLKRFKQITLGHPIIMGRKTYESIGRLLPGRENIILSRQSGFVVPGAVIARSLDESIRHCEAKGIDEAFVIGGAEIYTQAMKRAQRIHLTEIHHEVEGGDAFFPEIDPEAFREVSREERMEPFPHSFVLLEKK